MVNERLAVLGKELEAAFPSENHDLALVAAPIGRTMSVTPQTDTAIDVFSAFLLLLAGMILAIACLNVANLLLARGAARQTEIAVRLALGAGRGRLVGQLVAEGLVLSAVSTGLGLIMSTFVMGGLLESLATAFPFPMKAGPWPDWRVLLASAGTAVLSALAFGLGPALSLSREDLAAHLKHHSATGGPRARSGSRVLVVAQIALALVLLTAAGIFARTAWEAGSADPGHRYDRMLVAGLDATLGPYDESRGRQAFLRLVDGARGLPGVEFASLTSSLPFGDSHGGKTLETVGQAGGPVRGSARAYRVVGFGYFATLGIGLVRGREFTEAEEMGRSSRRAAIIDEALARRLFGAGDPIGQAVRVVNESQNAGEGAGAPIEIVGVAPPIRDELLARAPVPHLYLPLGSAYQPRMHV